MNKIQLQPHTSTENTPLVFFLFCIRLAELVELDEFYYNQSTMTESQLALWCSGHDS